MNEIINRLSILRDKMTEVGIDVCLIPTSDCHNSEYINEYYKMREYFSGFTGSAGNLVVSHDEAWLFTDGRYFIQAETELKGSGISLMKIGEPGVPKLNEHLINVLKAGNCLGFDGTLIDAQTGDFLAKGCEAKGCRIDMNFDVGALAWVDRPLLKFQPLSILPLSSAGVSCTDKISAVRNNGTFKEATLHIISSLDDIAWILNMRGNDIEYCPVFMSYMVMDRNGVYLYANITGDNKEEIKAYLNANDINLRNYENFYDEIEQNTNNWTFDKVLLDKETINYKILSILSKKKCTVINGINPSTSLKAVKNDIEIANIRKANETDGVAMLKFMKYIKEQTARGAFLTELDAAEYLDKLRAKSPDFIEPSFETISAFGEHGAIVHYGVDDKSDIRIKKEDNTLYLVDSGGHYINGTTDVTRTYAIGDVTEEMKMHYTLVVKSMLELLNTRFLYGCRGNNLDTIARTPIWAHGLDYRHGTGHGIGYILNVHEGPQRISFRIANENSVSAVFEPGMVTSDEPGLYFDGRYGIRVENDILCVEVSKGEYGRILGFEALTYVPIDLDCINKDYLSAENVEMLNDYHKLVFNKISPYLEGDDLEYLKTVTREI